MPKSLDPPPNGIITLLTDFGMQDPFVGVMKGVILGIGRDCTLVDLTHEIPPQNIVAGMFLLNASVTYFPEGTVHLAVVDPGVGSERKAIAVSALGHLFVAPDNGLLTGIIHRADEYRAVYLENPHFFLNSISQSFHGRDIFAPVAAHLACGTSLHALGSSCEAPVLLEVPTPTVTSDTILGEVLYVDHFGNLITNISRTIYDAKFTGKQIRVEICGQEIPGLSSCYAAVDPGTLLAIFTSFDRLEIAQRDGNAGRALDAEIGTQVRVCSVVVY